MRYEEVSSMIKSIGLPYAYYQFDVNDAHSIPFITFFFPYEDGVKADDKNYQKTASLMIELYCDKKDFDAEAKVEAALDAYDVAYAKDEMYIESERMFKIAYTTEVFING